MSLIKLDYSDVYDPEILPGGTEAQLRIIKMEEHTSEKGNESLHVVFDYPENPRVEDIHIYLGLPTSDQDSKMSNRRNRDLQQFTTCFGLNEDLDTEVAVGSTGWCVVKEEDDPQYGKKNTIKSFTRRA